MSDHDPDQPRKLAIAECVAAMDMLRQQVCGMYALLEEQHRVQQAAADRLDKSYRALQGLVDRLPNDVVTLTAIQHAAKSVDQSIATMPAAVTAAADALKTHTAGLFNAAITPHVQNIENASQHVIGVAKEMNRAIRRFDLLTAAFYTLTGVSIGLICGIGIYRWGLGDDITSIKKNTTILQKAVTDLAVEKRHVPNRLSPGR